MSNPGTLCRDEWAVLLLVHIAVLGSWLFSAGRGAKAVEMYYRSYRELRTQGRIPGAPAPQVFGIVWGLIYVLLVPAIFIFYYYDDACTSSNAAYDYRLELAAWILILLNLVLNKAWDAILSMRPFYYANLMAAILTLIVMLTAVAIAILLYIIASDELVHNALYFSAAVYTLYALWGIYATYLGFRQLSQLSSLKKK
jgi:tryptophan-rich sensory protein